jgi:hypothetical protein
MNQDESWEAIDPGQWRSTPCVTARLASEADVKVERAVLFLNKHEVFGCALYEMPLPHLATWSDPDGGRIIPGVIVQAEHADRKVLVGFRPLSGGNLLATLEEFRLVDNVDDLARDPS